MTLAELQSAIASLTYHTPCASVNVLGVENDGTDIFFNFDDSGLIEERDNLEEEVEIRRQQIEQLKREVEKLRKALP